MLYIVPLHHHSVRNTITVATPDKCAVLDKHISNYKCLPKSLCEHGSLLIRLTGNRGTLSGLFLSNLMTHISTQFFTKWLQMLQRMYKGVGWGGVHVVVVHMSSMYFINTWLSKEICLCILFVHEIPWKFTSELIANFHERACLRLTKHQSGLKLTYLFNQYPTKSEHCTAAVGECAQMGWMFNKLGLI